ncbi:MAG: oligogalacturonate lyase family protein [Anaerolineae bacterium]|nr:oligogalacturonate lyase family protein [Anaerolineae bacterium]
MGKGRIYEDKPFRYVDAFSGREIVQLTDYLGHSHHLYFTDPCWFNHDRSFVFSSDREGQSNLFRYDLDDYKITQLTDLRGRGNAGGCFSAANHCHYFWWQRELHELNIETLDERILYVAPEGMSVDRPSPTADGQYICSKLLEDPPQERAVIAFAYSRFHEYFHARPLTKIIRIEVATGQMEVLHEDRCYIGHINTSPKLPEIMTFCHEGPWRLVDQRIWGLNIQTGETWKIRPQDDGVYAVGHEYWFADGEHIGYHGMPRDERGISAPIFGRCKWDNSDAFEAHFPYHSTHFCSLDEQLIAGDGTPGAVFNSQGKALPFIQLFQWDGEKYVGPRALAYHRSTFNDQHAHPHPRFTPDGKSILYSSDLTRYANMYLVEVGDFDDLPVLTDDLVPVHT